MKLFYKLNIPGLILTAMLMWCGGLISHAQYDNVWVFGQHAGIDFNYNPPRAIETAIESKEAAASISDASGRLLFYTDGIRVWNRDHRVMPNGQSLGRHVSPSASQGAMIIPVPGSLHQYYVFTIGCWECGNLLGTLTYGIVDMSLDGGMGDLVQGSNDQELERGTSEHMAAVPGNNCDIWLIVLSRRLGAFKAFNISANGIDPAPVVSPAAPSLWSFLEYRELTGYMDISPDRKHLAIAKNDLTLYDFDAETGRISNPVSLVYGRPIRSCYGVAFSPDSRKLYTIMDTISTDIGGAGRHGEPARLVQFDLSVKDSLAMVRSRTLIDTVPWVSVNAMKRGHDGKIYMTNYSYVHSNRGLAVIHRPNLAGPACSLEYEGFMTLPDTWGIIGLPSTTAVLQNYFNYTVSDTVICGTYELAARDLSGTNFHWNDGTSGATRQVGGPGTYWVRYHRTGGSCVEIRTDTFRVYDGDWEQHVSVVSPQGCWQDTLQLSASGAGTAYMWQDGRPGASRTVSASGTYWVTYRDPADACRNFADTFHVTIPETRPHVSFEAEAYVCAGLPVLFPNTSDPYFNEFTWILNGSVVQAARDLSHTFEDAGTFSVQLIGMHDGGCPDTALAGITADSRPDSLQARVTPDPVCAGMPVSLHIAGQGSSATGMVWSLGDGAEGTGTGADTLIRHSYGEPGRMPVTVTVQFRACPELSRTDTVDVHASPRADLGPDTALCSFEIPLELYNLEAAEPYERYEWQSGESSRRLQVSAPGLYTLTVTNSSGCTASDSVRVSKDCYVDIPNAFTPNGDGVNDYFFPRDIHAAGLTSFRMQIFNRWGQLLFETAQLDDRGWDGTWNGQRQPDGVYVYQIRAAFKNGGLQQYKGNLTLLR